MNTYKIALLGHRYFCEQREVEEKLYSILRDIIAKNHYVEIYIGRNGEFDKFAASVLKRAQKAFGGENITINLVLPYTNKDILYYEQYYDDILIPQIAEKAHPKRAITERNKWMIEECDLFVCYIEHESGGAYKALQYAEKIGKKTINLKKMGLFSQNK